MRFVDHRLDLADHSRPVQRIREADIFPGLAEQPGGAHEAARVELERGIGLMLLPQGERDRTEIGRGRIGLDQRPAERERLLGVARLVSQSEGAAVNVLLGLLAAGLAELDGALEERRRFAALVEVDLDLGELLQPGDVVRLDLEEAVEGGLGPGHVVGAKRERDLVADQRPELVRRRAAAGHHRIDPLQLDRVARGAAADLVVELADDIFGVGAHRAGLGGGERRRRRRPVRGAHRLEQRRDRGALLAGKLGDLAGLAGLALFRLLGRTAALSLALVVANRLGLDGRDGDRGQPADGEQRSQSEFRNSHLPTSLSGAGRLELKSCHAGLRASQASQKPARSARGPVTRRSAASASGRRRASASDAPSRLLTRLASSPPFSSAIR